MPREVHTDERVWPLRPPYVDLSGIKRRPKVAVHHTGKNSDRGMRGHSSLLGAVETAIEVVHTKGERFWRVAKAKDDEAGGEHGFELVSYDVGTDQWNEVVRSCAVRPSTAAVTRSKSAPRGKHQALIIQALHERIKSGPPVLWPDAYVIAAACLPSNVAPGRRKSVAKAILDGLLLSGHVALSNGVACVA